MKSQSFDQGYCPNVSPDDFDSLASFSFAEQSGHHLD
jgi:hypothetical protein